MGVLMGPYGFGLEGVGCIVGVVDGVFVQVGCRCDLCCKCYECVDVF